MKETLKSMKQTLTAKAMEQMSCLDQTDAEELGEVIDMIKDLEETLYYCSIVEAMDKAADEKQEMRIANNTYYYTEPYYMMPKRDWDYERDMDKPYGKMYYGDGGNTSSSGGTSQGSGSSSNMNYYDPWAMRDSREGRSPRSRRQYMESKEMHADKMQQLKDLEKYMQELTTDIAEMIEDATPEEKQLLQKKISSLATKIEQMK